MRICVCWWFVAFDRKIVSEQLLFFLCNKAVCPYLEFDVLISGEFSRFFFYTDIIIQEEALIVGETTL